VFFAAGGGRRTRTNYLRSFWEFLLIFRIRGAILNV
jgi:hypothetical protein